ncbi:MAG: hypothetical protein NVS2B7_24300 [Herpetosiphon sp.]
MPHVTNPKARATKTACARLSPVPMIPGPGYLSHPHIQRYYFWAVCAAMLMVSIKIELDACK